MFTLGNKEVIVNGPSQLPVTVDTDLLRVQSFAGFKAGNVLKAYAQRYAPAVQGVVEVTVPSPAAIGVGADEFQVPVTFNIYMKSKREEAEYAIDFIENGRPFALEIEIDGTDTATQVAEKLDEGIKNWVFMFNKADLPFTSVQAANLLTLTIKPGIEHLDFVPQATLTASRMGTARTVFAKKLDVTQTTKSEEAINSGKFLEENVAIANHANDGSYAIGGPNKTPDINGKYVSITIVAQSTPDGGIDGAWAGHARLSTVAADTVVGNGEMTFTLYFKEETALMDFDDDVNVGGDTSGDVQKVADFLVNETIATIDTFYKADGTAATDVADFLA